MESSRMKRWNIILVLLTIVSCREGAEQATRPEAPKEVAQEALPKFDPVAKVRKLAEAKEVVGTQLEPHLFAPGEARIWAVYGLGRACSSDPGRVGHLLSSALPTWILEGSPSADEVAALCFALGSCGTIQTENVLRSFLNPKRDLALPGGTESAALALTELADRRGKLEERTLTALLDAAEREKDPRLLLPLGRVRSLSDPLRQRALEVGAELLLTGKPEARGAAILSLYAASKEARLPIARIVQSSDYTALERNLGASLLGKLDAQSEIEDCLNALLSGGLPNSERDPIYPVVVTLLRGLGRPERSKETLTSLVRSPPRTGPEPLLRREAAVRCLAAERLAWDRPNDPSLLACDPGGGDRGAIALANVIGRGKLDATRGQQLSQVFQKGSPAVQRHILQLLPAHPEFGGASALLGEGLSKEVASVRAAAWDAIATRPLLADAGEKEPKLASPVEAALKRELGRGVAYPDVEAKISAIKAVGALSVLTFKPELEQLCAGPDEVLHEVTARALSLLGSKGKRCDSPAELGASPNESSHAESKTGDTLHLSLETDVGTLEFWFDEPYAELAIRELHRFAASGYWDGSSVTHVTPGYAVHLGESKPAEGAHELTWISARSSPRGFPAYSVSLGSLSEQFHTPTLVVNLAAAPAFAGRRVRVGRAEGPFDLLLAGDRIHSSKLQKVPAKRASAPVGPGPDAEKK